MKREYTGTWIPRHIVENTELTLVEKWIFAETSNFRECTLSNSSFAERCSCSEMTIKNSLNTLIEKGYIRRKVDKMSGNIRVLTVNYNEEISTPSDNSLPTLGQKDTSLYIDKSKINSETKVSPSFASSERTVQEVDEDGNPIARVWRSKRVVKIDSNWNWQDIENKMLKSPLAIDKLCLRYIRRKGLVFKNQGHWELERTGMLRIAKELVKAGVTSKLFDSMCDMAEEVKEDWTIHTTRGFLTKAMEESL